MKICPNCGAENEDNALNCILCEYEFEVQPYDNSSESNNDAVHMNYDSSTHEQPVMNTPVYSDIPANQSPKSNNKIAIIAIAAVLIVGMSIGSMFLLNYQKGKSSSKPENNKAVTTELQTTSPESTTVTEITTEEETTTATMETTVSISENVEVSTNAPESVPETPSYETEKQKILASVDNERYQGKDSHIENAPADMVFYDIDGTLTQIELNPIVLYEVPGEEYKILEGVPSYPFDIVGENNDWYYLRFSIGSGKFTHYAYGYARKKTPPPEINDTEIEDAKNKAIAEFNQTNSFHGNPYYGSYDLNGDGIQELIILYYDVVDTSCNLYAFNGSSYINLNIISEGKQEIWGDISICLDKHYIMCHKNGGGEGYDIFEFTQDNTIKKIDYINYYAGTYTRNEIQISKTEFDLAIESYNTYDWINLSQILENQNNSQNTPFSDCPYIGNAPSDMVFYEGSSFISGIVSTNDTGLNMRKGPGTNYDIIIEIPQNARIDILGMNTEWCYIRWTNSKKNETQYGFVSKQYVSY